MSDILNSIISSLPPNHVEMFLRLTIATVLGLIIGLERELTNKTAGLRTQMLVCIGSALFTVLSIYAFPPRVNSDGSFVPADPARVAAQIVTGVGFIGGSAVIKSGFSVFGITTAASLWMSAAVGMAAGCGDFYTATVSTVLSVSILAILGLFEKRVLKKQLKREDRLKVTIHTKPDTYDYIQEYLNKNFNNLLEVNVTKSKKKEGLININFIIDIYSTNPTGEVYKKLKDMEGYQTINVKQMSD